MNAAPSCACGWRDLCARRGGGRASNQLGEFESGATAALLGPVGSVVLGGLGTLVVAALWWRLFPALARRDALVLPGTAARVAQAATGAAGQTGAAARGR